MTALMRWDPFHELEEMSDRLNRMVARSATKANGKEALTVADWMPAVNISETASEYVIQAELPAVKKEDVKVTLEEGVLTIQGQRSQEKDEKTTKHHRIERSYGTFVRIISNRATELLGGVRGSKLVHPNDHVNLGQSSNDVIPTAIHIAAGELMQQHLIPALTRLQKSLNRKAKEFDTIVKIGRTHLQDATPVRLGQEFGGYARQIELSIQRVKRAQDALSEVALGGTAVGTGLNCHPKFSSKVMAIISKETGCTFKEAKNHFEAQSAQDSLVEASGELRTIAVSLMKIANDVRWLGSGPRCGFGEINLPETQPGSSIMPGKVNPVIAESVTMVCAQVIGNDVTVTVGGQAANFELIVMLPVMAYNLLQSIELLASVSNNFAVKCIDGIKANEERCKNLIEESLAMCTALAPEIGYEAAAKLAKDAYKSGKTVREVAKEQQVLSDKRLTELLDPWRMTMPGGPVGSAGG
ncbi:hypothetical protein B566_EDAN000512 [Ephemera danica]|nr:hypothetical protein B566_EDAN000512 [Ephemera danica]